MSHVAHMNVDSRTCRGVKPPQVDLQYIVPHCNTLQHTAANCNKLQHTATHAATACGGLPPQIDIATLCNSGKYCNTLQHTATHCSTLQHTATDAAGATNDTAPKSRRLVAGP